MSIEEHLADELRRIADAQPPYEPDLATIERLARSLHRRCFNLRAGSGARIGRGRTVVDASWHDR